MSALPTPRRIAIAAGADVLAVIVFVLMGRNSHHEDGGLGDAVSVMAPFLIALAVGWVATRAWLKPLAPVPTGIQLWLITAAGGLLLRRFVFDRSTAMAFVIVGSVFLLVALVGWRMIAEWVRERR